MQVRDQRLMICGTRLAIGHSFKLLVPVMEDSGYQDEGGLANTALMPFDNLNCRAPAQSVRDTYTSVSTVLESLSRNHSYGWSQWICIKANG